VVKSLSTVTATYLPFTLLFIHSPTTLTLFFLHFTHDLSFFSKTFTAYEIQTVSLFFTLFYFTIVVLSFE